MPSAMETVRLVISALGFATALWCLRESLVDVMALYGIDGRGWLPHRMHSRLRVRLDQTIALHNGSLRTSAWFGVQRAGGRALVIGFQLVLAVSGMLESSAGADWKILLQMIGVGVLSINAASDVAERRRILTMHEERRQQANG